ncbi:MAG: kynureninase [Comamonas sp. SCN 65-56]|uniref:kynureninase n=1 Tax=Comamonas sp. SCN 65-56 TaxID=1660095 RepID=UPI000869D7A5|nr:kynureninase [Comamonas sp. SCN 65-56]ODS93705.1 MAG: kynureninase [Comamonas sp. SCN 65-56]
MTSTTPTMASCQARDAADPLRPLRALFTLPEGVIYLDGNSLGALPRAVPERVAQVVAQQWGQDLIGSWNSAGWFALPRRVGDRIAPLIGAGPGEVVASDTTSVNLYKALSAALSIAQENDARRRVVVSERSNFPTDLYIAEALCRERGCQLRLIEAHELPASLQPDVAVLLLSQVNYRTGALHDMAQVTAAAHAAGVLTLWDLCHSAGALPIALNAADADFAVGCTYKYLNGGPGSPAFVWVHPRHVARCWQPLAGWWGHAQPFAFTPDYQPAMDITRYQCGTQPILSLSALDAALDVFDAAEKLGGMAALRAKSLQLTDLFIDAVQTECPGLFDLVTPRAHAERGSQVCLTPTKLLPEGCAYAIVQALIARGVIGDFRAGDAQQSDILRFGFTPLYLSHENVLQASHRLRDVLSKKEYTQPRFNQRHAVT